MGAAQEVAVTVGNTTANVDIRHDQRPGYSVSGKVIGLSPGGSSLNFSVFRLDSGMLVASSDYFRSDITSYAVPGLTDGDYLVQATQISASQKQGIFASSAAPRRFTVKGGSVAGVDVVFRPASGLSGKVTMAYSDPGLSGWIEPSITLQYVAGAAGAALVLVLGHILQKPRAT